MFIFRAEIKMLTAWFKKMCALQRLKVPSSSPRTNGWRQGGNVHHLHADCGLHQQLSLKHSHTHKSNAAKIHHTQLTHSYRAATNNRTTVNHKAQLWNSQKFTSSKAAERRNLLLRLTAQTAAGLLLLVLDYQPRLWSHGASARSNTMHGSSVRLLLQSCIVDTVEVRALNRQVRLFHKVRFIMKQNSLRCCDVEIGQKTNGFQTLIALRFC